MFFFLLRRTGMLLGALYRAIYITLGKIPMTWVLFYFIAEETEAQKN